MEAVLQGRNGSVFCYGATGAGKTYTMLGTIENPGVMVLAIKDLFSKIRQRSFDGNHVVHLSYLEVYNETVRDLLSPGRPLVLREDKQVCSFTNIDNFLLFSHLLYLSSSSCSSFRSELSIYGRKLAKGSSSHTVIMQGIVAAGLTQYRAYSTDEVCSLIFFYIGHNGVLVAEPKFS